ncbi:MAG: IS1595 family transposase [Solirubrobacteraceae bacterium]
MQLGSYQTAWAMLHRYRSVMVRPGRERLTGEVEVDESYIGGPEPGIPGRGALGKVLFAAAVERETPRSFGRARVGVIKDASAQSLWRFLIDNVEPGSRVITDGWPSYPQATEGLYTLDATNVSESGKYIPKERLGATDDCGFSPFSRDLKPKHGSPDFARDIAMQKISNRVRGARMVSEELGL